MAWPCHEHRETSVKKKLGFLYRCKSFFNVQQLCLIYKSFIQPCMEYCCHVWGAAAKTNLDLLDRLQNRSLFQKSLRNNAFARKTCPGNKGWNYHPQLPTPSSATSYNYATKLRDNHELAINFSISKIVNGWRFYLFWRFDATNSKFQNLSTFVATVAPL